MGQSIRLVSGKFFDFVDLDSNKWSIEDAAHNLSRICRFNGAVPGFYSVAEHSVYVSRQFTAPWDRLMGILHDVHEGWIGDMTAPLKQLCPDFRALEERIQEHTLRRFGIHYPLPEKIKRADQSVFLAETQQLFGESYLDFPDVTPAEIYISCLDKDDARQFFLTEYDRILLAIVGKLDAHFEE